MPVCSAVNCFCIHSLKASSYFFAMYQDICLKTCEIAREAGRFIRQEGARFSAEKVEVKGLHNFVSYVDKSSEKQIVAALRTLLPEAGFIAEEGTSAFRADRFNWVIDPLDGTTNFIHGLSPYSVSIALMEYDAVVVGVVYEPQADECFYTWADAPAAYLNGLEIRVSARNAVDDCLIATGFPYTDFLYMRQYLPCLQYFMEHSHGVRRLGSAAIDLAYTAAGRFDAFYEYGLHPWDVAAGVLLVQKAGGCVSDFSGGKNYLFGGEMIASNGAIAAEFRDAVSRYLGPPAEK